MYRIVPRCKDENPAPFLNEPIVRGVYDPPFHGVTEVGEASEDDAEVAAPLGRRRFQEPVDILQEDVHWTAALDYVANVPPQHALFPLDAFGVGSRHRIVLAWESAHQQVETLWNLTLRQGDVLVDLDTRVKVPVITIEANWFLQPGSHWSAHTVTNLSEACSSPFFGRIR